MFKIALTAGHYLHTPGKRCLKKIDPAETREWVLNDRICDKVEKLLSDYDGYSLVRTDDTLGKKNISLSQRAKKANDFGADIYISVHHNAGINGGSGGGIEAYVYLKVDKKTEEWQDALYDSLIKHTGLKGNRSNPLRRSDLFECRATNMPAVLLELGFMDSIVDTPIILTDEYANNCAKAIVEVIVEKGNLTKKNEQQQTQTKPKDDKISVFYKTWDDVQNTWLPFVTDLTDYAGIYGHDVCCVYAELSKGNVYYKVHTKGGRWLPEVKNTDDYAGIYNRPIDAIMFRTDTGRTIHYAVHIRRLKRWLPFVTGYNQKESINGYAGIIGQEIDGLKIYVD